MNSEKSTTRARVATADDLGVGEMKLAKVGERRIAVVRTPSGIHALDNACPHQGYGLVTGSLDGELLTCQWHNWKYRVTDGKCVIGEEDVACHAVEIVDGEVMVEVTEPTAEERREVLWPSLMSGLAKDYPGQMARDTVRLLDAGAEPVDIVWAGVKHGAPRTEWGLGHELPMAADCLRLALDDHEIATTAVVQALAGIAEDTRGRDPWPVPEPDGSADLVEAIETEDVNAAMARVVADVHAGVPLDTLAGGFIDAASRHHYNYGHGAIFVQKAFELLDHLDLAEAEHLLPHLAANLAWSTREDTLPYMKKAMAELDTVDLDAMVATSPNDDIAHRDAFVDALLTSSEAPIADASRQAIDGLGVVGLLDAVTIAVSKRLLRHDLDLEFRLDDPFGWLDITHGLTYARAARWAWNRRPGPATARLALFTVWLAYDTGRGERRNQVIAPLEAEAPSLDLEDAILRHDETAAIAAALGGDHTDVDRSLRRASLFDHAGSFIVQAHLVKMALAAGEEAEAIGSSLPLAATARFMAAPRLERFVARNVQESERFVATGRPPLR